MLTDTKLRLNATLPGRTSKKGRQNAAQGRKLKEVHYEYRHIFVNTGGMSKSRRCVVADADQPVYKSEALGLDGHIFEPSNWGQVRGMLGSLTTYKPIW